MAAANPFGSAFDNLVDPLRKALGSFAEALRGVPDQVKGFTQAIGEAVKASGAGGAVGAVGGAIGAGGAAYAGFQAAIGAANDAFARVTGTLTSLTDSVTKVTAGLDTFVGALSPGAMEFFSEALRNVNATIGQALLPVIQVASATLNEMSGALTPIMQQLAPVMRDLASSLLGLVVPALDLFGAILEAILPVLQVIADVFKVFADVIKIVVVVFKAIVDALKASGIFTLFKDVISALMDGLRLVIKSLVYFVAAIAKLMGADLGKFIADLEKQHTKTVNAAPQNAAVKGWDEIRTSITNSAFVAGGQTGGKKTDDFLAEIVAELKKLNAKTNEEVKGEIKDAAVDTLAYALDQVNKALNLGNPFQRNSFTEVFGGRAERKGGKPPGGGADQHNAQPARPGVGGP